MNDVSQAKLLQLVEKLQNENALLQSQASAQSHSRLMAEEALGDTKDRLQLALDAASLAMWEWDIVNATVFTSAQFEVILLDLPRTAAVDRQWSAIEFASNIDPEDQSMVRDATVHFLKQDISRLELEFRLGIKNSQVWVECIGRVIQRDMFGHAERVVGVLRDITQRRQQQHEIEVARAQAVTASAAKDDFLANISHEIRTPLNGIIGMNQLLAQTELSTEQRKYVGLVSSSGHVLLSLVNELLDYSRIQAQGVVLERISFPLRRWLWDLSEPLRLAAQAKGLELQLVADKALPSEVVGDPGRMRQIVTNLVTNAIKFTSTGSVTINMAKFEQTDAAMPSDTQFVLQLQVRDTGVGIAHDKQEAIFQAFVQADSSTSRRYGGTGLGLSICDQLVKLMGGSIELESAPEQGSCFTVCIPIARAQDNVPTTNFGALDVQVSIPPTTSNYPSYAGKLALVVDDHPINQLLATKLLQRLGFEVLVADDGAQAVSLVTSHPVDVVLMDIQMPIMNGWEATQAIRTAQAHAECGRVTVIALSANASVTDREQADRIGMDGYLSKPLTPEALQSVLRKTLDDPNNQSKTVMQTVSEPLDTRLVAASTDHLNRALLLKRLGGDEEALREMTAAFCHDLRQRMGVVFEALKRQEWPTITSQSHALKGALLTMTAAQAAQDAKTLELAGRDADYAASVAAFKQLSESSRRVFSTVKDW